MPVHNIYFPQGLNRVVIDTNQTNLNLFEFVGQPSAAAEWEFIVQAGVQINALAIIGQKANPALRFGTGWAAGTRITVIVEGEIVGAGGTGGNADVFLGLFGGSVFDQDAALFGAGAAGAGNQVGFAGQTAEQYWVAASIPIASPRGNSPFGTSHFADPNAGVQAVAPTKEFGGTAGAQVIRNDYNGALTPPIGERHLAGFLGGEGGNNITIWPDGDGQTRNSYWGNFGPTGGSGVGTGITKAHDAAWHKGSDGGDAIYVEGVDAAKVIVQTTGVLWGGGGGGAGECMWVTHPETDYFNISHDPGAPTGGGNGGDAGQPGVDRKSYIIDVGEVTGQNGAAGHAVAFNSIPTTVEENGLADVRGPTA